MRWALLIVLGFYGPIAASLIYLRFLPPLTTGVQVERRVEALLSGADYEKRYTFLPIEQISENLRRAVIAAEDTRFYDHRGFDWVEFRKEREEAARRGTPPRGASTITQQLVKNLYFTTDRSYVRKGLEWMITPAAEAILGKDRILELYVNVIEWGPGVYGAEAAATSLRNLGGGDVSGPSGSSRGDHPRAAATRSGADERLREHHPDPDASDGMVKRAPAVVPCRTQPWVEPAPAAGRVR